MQFYDESLDGLPLVSCIMPTYGRPDFVNESVAMFLAQDYPHKELIVLNDCPGQTFDGDFPGVRFINRATRYPTLGEKRNACIDAARGPLIAVWDDDDVYLPWRLSFSVRELQRHRTPFYRAAEFWAYWGTPTMHHNQSIPGWMNHPNTLYTKDLWRRAGGYPARGVGEDSDLFTRFDRLLGKEFIKYDIHPVDRFFVMRGTSAYVHMSMTGGQRPLDESPGARAVVPARIADETLRAACDQLIADRRLRTQSWAPAVMPSLSICVSLKNRSRIVAEGKPLHLFPNCVRRLAESTDGLNVELIVADFHSDDWPLAEWLPTAAGRMPCQVIQVDGDFSKGKGLNLAAAAARFDRLLFLDADMLLTRDVLRQALEIVDQGRVWLPIHRDLDSGGNPAGWSNFATGNIAFERGLLSLAGGVPEFHSWGGEDNIFADNLQRYRPAERNRVDGLFHQWHPESNRHMYYARPARADYHDYVARQNDLAKTSVSDPPAASSRLPREASS